MEDILTISFDQKWSSLSGRMKLLFQSWISSSDLVLFYVEPENMVGLKKGVK